MSLLRYKIAKRIYKKVQTYKWKKHAHMLRILKGYDKKIHHAYWRGLPMVHQVYLKNYLPNNISDLAQHHFLRVDVGIKDYDLEGIGYKVTKKFHPYLVQAFDYEDMQLVKFDPSDNLSWFMRRYGLWPPTNMTINHGTQIVPPRSLMYCEFKNDIGFLENPWADRDMCLSFSDFLKKYKQAYNTYVWKEICSKTDRFLYKIINIFPYIKKQSVKGFQKIKGIFEKIKSFQWELFIDIWWEVGLLLMVLILVLFLTFGGVN